MNNRLLRAEPRGRLWIAQTKQRLRGFLWFAALAAVVATSVALMTLVVLMMAGRPLPNVLAALVSIGFSLCLVVLTFVTDRASKAPSDALGRTGTRMTTQFVATATIAVLAGLGLLFIVLAGNAPAIALAGMGLVLAICILAAIHEKRRESWPPDAAVEHDRTRPARDAFASAVGFWMALYILAVANVSWLFDIEAWPAWARIVAAIAPALPIGGVIVALLRYLKREPDEYQRLLLTRAVLIATGATFFLLTAWGFLELYVGAPHFPVSLAMAPFWIFFAIANWWVRRRA